MMNKKEIFHGSDIERIAEIYNIDINSIIKFGANVNPLGLSGNFLKKMPDLLDRITAYPDRDYVSLRKHLSEYVNTPYENIIVGNGTSELINLSIRAVNPGNATIIAPAYSEYANSLEKIGSKCKYASLKKENDFILKEDQIDDLFDGDTKMLITCNPNNPTSTLIDRDMMIKILDKAVQKNAFVLVDETYIEFTPDVKKYSSIPLCEKYKNLIVLRGISKFFASPGLRFGYAICSDENLRAAILSSQDPWSVNSLAECGVPLLLEDKEYIEKSSNYIHKEREFVYNELSQLKKLTVYKPYANFILCHIHDSNYSSADLFDICIKKGYMIRDCQTFQTLDDTFFRFCFMEHEHNEGLIKTIKEYLK